MRDVPIYLVSIRLSCRVIRENCYVSEMITSGAMRSVGICASRAQSRYRALCSPVAFPRSGSRRVGVVLTHRRVRDKLVAQNQHPKARPRPRQRQKKPPSSKGQDCARGGVLVYADELVSDAPAVATVAKRSCHEAEWNATYAQAWESRGQGELDNTVSRPRASE